MAGGCPGREGPRAPRRRSGSGGLGLPGLSRPDLARASPPPLLRTPVSGAHGRAMAEPPESREEWRVAEVRTIETRKRAALARGEGRPRKRRDRGVAARRASSRGPGSPAPSQCGRLSVFSGPILGGRRPAPSARRRRAGRGGLRGAAAGHWRCLGTHAGRPGRPRSQKRKAQRQE